LPETPVTERPPAAPISDDVSDDTRQPERELESADDEALLWTWIGLRSRMPRAAAIFPGPEPAIRRPDRRLPRDRVDAALFRYLVSCTGTPRFVVLP
jgi:hypothetical protein